MADLVVNIAKGRVVELVRRVDANDPAGAVLLVVPLETTGLESDATLKDKDTLADLLSGATNEQATIGRKTLTDSDVTFPAPDDTNDRYDVDIPDQTWVAATGNAISKLAICYGEGGADSTVIPLTLHDFVVTPDGSDITAQVASAGFFRAS